MSFEELFKNVTPLLTVRHFNIQSLATEMLKVSNNITATIINELFKICFHSFNIHSKSNFVVPVVHTIHRSSHIEVLLVKGVLKIRSKFTGEHPCRSNFIEITLRHGCSPVYLLHIFRTPFS